MSNLATHEAEQAALTALCEAGECGHADCQPETITNWTRAERGLAAITAWKAAAGETGTPDDPGNLSDLLADLMHYARLCRTPDGDDIDFAAALETARINFDAEANEEPDQ